MLFSFRVLAGQGQPLSLQQRSCMRGIREGAWEVFRLCGLDLGVLKPAYRKPVRTAKAEKLKSKTIEPFLPQMLQPLLTETCAYSLHLFQEVALRFRHLHGA
jgi:hypothetical protein